MLPEASKSRLNTILTWVCAVLFVLNALAAINALSNLPNFYRQAATLTLPDIPFEGYSYASNLRIINEAALREMSIPEFLNYRIALDLVYAFVFYVVAFMIARRARGQWFLWFTAMILLFVPSGQIAFYSRWDSMVTKALSVLSILWPAFPLFLYLFPNGRAVPGWMRWLIGPVLLIHFALQFMGWLGILFDRNLVENEFYLRYVWVLLVSFPLAMISQVYRYLRVSTREERLQTKWVMGGLVFIIFIDWVVLSFFGQVDIAGDQGFLSDLSNLVFLVIPISIGISILRYRLYDIDLIIRRTLQYGALSAVLALVYFGLVVVLGQAVQGLTGQQSPLVVVVSTLVIAAIFTPLRRGTQQIIDRRFYRTQYNAGRVLEAFSQNLRHEVDLAAIEEQLVRAVDESIQPVELSLWMRKVRKS